MVDICADGFGPVLKYLIENHQELESISISFPEIYNLNQGDQDMNLADEDMILQIIFLTISLRSITVDGIKSHGEILSPYPAFTLFSLEKLILKNCFQLTDKGLYKMLNISGSKLIELELSQCAKITGIGLTEEVKSLPRLEILKVENCIRTDTGLHELLSISGSKLKELDLCGSSITGEGFKEGVRSLPNLEILRICWCHYLTDRGLREILEISGRYLNELRLCYTTEITGIGLEELNLPSLEILYMTACDELTNKGFQNILINCRSTLKEFYLCDFRLSCAGFLEKVKSLPNLEVLKLGAHDRGIQEILSTTGNKLKTLHVCQSWRSSSAMLEHVQENYSFAVCQPFLSSNISLFFCPAIQNHNI